MLKKLKDDSDKSMKDKNNKDPHLDKSLILYIDFIVEELSNHLFGY